MVISDEELEYLRKLKREPNEDDIRYKEVIKRRLLKNNKIIYLLHNKELEEKESENDDYFGDNILPFYLISPVQTTVKNYLCFETSFESVSRYNSVMKNQQVIFYILCHNKDINVTEVGVARHDLIASVLIDEYNGSNIFGTQLKLISDKPSVVDNNYSARTLIFEQITTNSITNKDGKEFNLRAGAGR